MNAAEVAVHAADTAAAETRYRLALAAEMFTAGYRAAEADMAARWNRIARAATSGPSLADVELRRWGPGGRARFGEPREGDYPGKEAAAP